MAEARVAIPPTRITGQFDDLDEPARFVVDSGGLIRECSRSAERLFGYGPSELVGHPVSMLLPALIDPAVFDGDLPTTRLAFLCHCGVLLEAVRRDGRTFATEVSPSRVGIASTPMLQLILRKVSPHSEMLLPRQAAPH